MNLGMPEMLFLFVLALLLFGPKRLPEIGRQVGKALAEFKKASDQFKVQIETEVRNLEAETHNQTIAPPATQSWEQGTPSSMPRELILPPEERDATPASANPSHNV